MYYDRYLLYIFIVRGAEVNVYKLEVHSKLI